MKPAATLRGLPSREADLQAPAARSQETASPPASRLPRAGYRSRAYTRPPVPAKRQPRASPQAARAPLRIGRPGRRAPRIESLSLPRAHWPGSFLAGGIRRLAGPPFASPALAVRRTIGRGWAAAGGGRSLRPGARANRGRGGPRGTRPPP